MWNAPHPFAEQRAALVAELQRVGHPLADPRLTPERRMAVIAAYKQALRPMFILDEEAGVCSKPQGRVKLNLTAFATAGVPGAAILGEQAFCLVTNKPGMDYLLRNDPLCLLLGSAIASSIGEIVEECVK